MTPNYYFNFANFKTAMEIPDIDESTYGIVLRSIFAYINRVYAIDLTASYMAATTSATTVSFTVPYSADIEIGMLVQAGAEYATITNGVADDTLTTLTLTVSPAFSIPPVSVDITTIVADFDLQYAVYLHAKFLVESQKKNTFILDSVTDSNGNKATYKLKPPALVAAIYGEYSPNAQAFI
jgi:hypothetical protein